MASFKPFANDTQVVTFPSGEEELSLENGQEEVVLTGTLVLRKGDPASRASLAQLQQELSKVLAALG